MVETVLQGMNSIPDIPKTSLFTKTKCSSPIISASSGNNHFLDHGKLPVILDEGALGKTNYTL
jgi:hypothetical protein